MKFKDVFLLTTILSCLTVVSTSCYGNGTTGKNPNGTVNGGTTYPGVPSTNGRAQVPTTSSAYSYNNGSNVKGYAGSSQGSVNSNPGTSCSTTDLSVFEEADEHNVYNTYGFTRGDIKNLYIFKYDPKSEQTINGNVERIMRVQFPDGNCYFIAVVKIDTGDVLVNLGPVWFADENNMVLNEGDAVQITGSLVRTNGRYILIASQLRMHEQTLLLRNQSGSPQWGTPKSQKGTNVN